MDWQATTLGDVCEFENGDRGKNYPSRAKFVDSGIAFINAGHVDDGIINFSTMNYISDITFSSLSRGKVKTGDVLFCLRGSLGKFAIVDKEMQGAIASSLVIIRPKKLSAEFLAHYLRSGECQKEIEKYAAGAAQPNLGAKDLAKFEIPLPPIPEQQRIVAILDQAFADIEKARANAEKNLKNARELFDSYLNQVFSQRGEGWVDAKMSEVCEGKITDGTHQTPKYFDSGYIFLSSKNVTSGKIDWDNVKYLDESQHIEMQKRLSPRKNDILLAKNGTTGVAAIVDKDVVFDIYVSLALLRPSNKILPRYLLHFVNSPLAKSQFNKRLKGIGVPNLHLKEIRDVIVSLPVSIEEQSQIIFQVDTLLAKRSRLEEIYSKKLSSLKELKKSLLQKAFSGELTKTEGQAA